MAAPTYIGKSGAQGGAGSDITLSWPSGHQAGDIAILVYESANQTPTNVADLTGDGWTALQISSVGTAGSTTATRAGTYWKRATSSAENNVTLASTTINHILAEIFLFRGCIASGTPWDARVAGNESTADTSLDATGVTTTVNDTLVVLVVGAAVGTSQAFTTISNSNLSSISEREDYANTAAGNGGAIMVATGVMATAGATGTSTSTLTTASAKAWVTFALKPPANALYTQSLPATAVGAVAFAKRMTAFRSLSNAAVGVVTLARVAKYKRTMSAVAVGVRTLSKFRRYLRTMKAYARVGVIDDFNRANGTPIDATHPWVNSGSGSPTILSNQLARTGNGDLIWDEIFPDDQQARVVWANSNWPTQAILYLKCQGTTPSSPCIQVIYDNAAATQKLFVETWDGTISVVRAQWNQVVNPGDEIWARATPAGVVEVYLNQQLVGTATITAWAQYANPGRTGLGWFGVNNTTFRADDFGGGGGAGSRLARKAIHKRTLSSIAAGIAALTKQVSAGKAVYMLAVGIGVPTLVRKQIAKRAMLAIATSVAALAKTPKRFRALAAAAVGVGILSKRALRPRSLAAAGIGVAALAKRKKALRAMAAAGIGLVALARLALRRRTLSAGGSGIPFLNKRLFLKRVLAAVGTGVAALARRRKAFRAFAATAIGVASLARTIGPKFVPLFATAAGVATIARRKLLKRSMLAAAVGVASKHIKAFRTMAAAGVGLVALSRRMTKMRAMAAAGIGVATLARRRKAFRSLSAAGIGVVALTRLALKRRTLAAIGVGAPAFARRVFAKRAMSRAAVGVATLSRRMKAFRALAAVGIGVAALSRILGTRVISMVAHAVGVAALSRRALRKRSLSAAGHVSIALLRGTSQGFVLLAQAVGVATLSRRAYFGLYRARGTPLPNYTPAGPGTTSYERSSVPDMQGTAIPAPASDYVPADAPDTDFTTIEPPEAIP